MTPEEIKEAKAERDKILKLSVWKREIRGFVAQRAGGRCESCGIFLGRVGGQVDHKIPRKDCEAHGIDMLDVNNLQWLCPPCHSKKSNAERWAGHVRKPKSLRRVRSKVPGRKLMLAMAGIVEGLP